MGFFSWKTADTNQTIPNIYSDHEDAGKMVYMLLPNGQKPIACSGYDGYGMFGGVDAYAWLAKMNIESMQHLDLYEDKDELREAGIGLSYSNEKIKYPLKFSFHANAQYTTLKASENCEFQGFFY